MNPRTYLIVCGAIFFVVAAAHLARLILGWDVSVAGHSAPRWLSVVGLAIAGWLSARGFFLATRAGRAT